jgi:hypothetical protein
VASRRLYAESHTPPVRFVRASALADPDREADLVIGRYGASALGRWMLFSTEAHGAAPSNRLNDLGRDW